MTRVLVTGGAGFLGSNVAAALARRADVELVVAGDVRELRRDGRAWLVRERTSATTLQVRTRADGYDLTIESVAGGAPSP